MSRVGNREGKNGRGKEKEDERKMNVNIKE